MKLNDLTGRTFGRLKVQERAECPKQFVSDRYRSTPWWLCKCECGQETVKPGTHLKHGLVRSCGCLNSEHGRAVAATLNQRRAMPMQLRTKIKQMILEPRSDDRISKDLGISHRTVAKIRKDLNIPAYNRWGVNRQTEVAL